MVKSRERKLWRNGKKRVEYQAKSETTTVRHYVVVSSNTNIINKSKNMITLVIKWCYREVIERRVDSSQIIKDLSVLFVFEIYIVLFCRIDTVPLELI